MTKLENDLSASYTNLISKYEIQKEKAKQVKDRLYHLSKELIKREIADLRDCSDKVRHYSFLDPNDIMEIGNALSPEINNTLCLIDDLTNTVFLFSNSIDCGKLVKENAPKLDGKGGGGRNFARAVFSSAEKAVKFIDNISE